MLRLVIDNQIEFYDQKKNEFFMIKKQTLELEHSLISLSRWESKWKRPFLDNLQRGTLSLEETIDYIRCMTINKVNDDRAYATITNEQMNVINSYINDPMTATTINESLNKGSQHEILTNELIYYYMLTAGIPYEFEKWHLNRLIMLIRVFGAKSEKPKKMSRNEIYNRNAAINAANRAKFKSKG